VRPGVFIGLGLSGLLAAVSAGQSTSASYSLLTSPAGDHGGGGQVTGSTVVAEIAVGGPVSGIVSNVSSQGLQMKGNFIGQLYDAVAIDLFASPDTIGEGLARQLTVIALLDDTTTLTLLPAEIAYSHSGPIAGIDAVTGVATADVVYTDRSATATATHKGLADTLQLTILNIATDNYREYAGDGLDDAWQFANFGEPPNNAAAPGADPDGDRFSNTFEFLTGYSPTDSADRFGFAIVARNGNTAALELSKVIPSTIYRVQRSRDLGQSDDWTTFATIEPATEMLDHPVEDAAATGDRWFYRVEIAADPNP